MDNSKRKFHHLFAHQVLPFLVFENPRELYNRLTEWNRDHYLENMWNDLNQKLKCEYMLSTGLSCEVFPLVSHGKLVLIRMPRPELIPEALYIGIAFQLERRLFKETVMSVRYFTLEFSFPSPIGEKTWAFCEWTNNKEHVNNGRLIDGRIETFRRSIEQTIAGITIDTLQPNASSVDTDNVFEKEDDNVQSSGLDDWEEELGRIWNKWTNFPTPDGIKEQIEKQVKPLEKLLTNIVEMCINYKLLPSNLASEAGAYTGTALAQLARGSFMVGLEMGPILIREGIDYKNEEPIYNPLLKLLGEASKPVVDFGTTLLSKLEDEGVLPASKVQEWIETFEVAAYQTSYDCAVYGFEVSSKQSEVERNQKQDDVMVPDQSLIEMVTQVARSDPDPDVRKAAWESVKELFPGGSEGVDHLISTVIKFLSMPDKRDYAVTMIRGFGSLSIPHLINLLGDENPETRMMAIKLITLIKEDEKKMVKIRGKNL